MNVRMPKYDSKGNLQEIRVISKLEVVGYCSSSYLITLRERADRLNQDDPKYIYSVIRNPKGPKYGYYLIRELN
jgi:hypothetical protein